MSHLTCPTKEQVDMFGTATDGRNKADKVRNAVYPLFKLSYEQDGLSLFVGDRWQVKASTTNRRSLDAHKLIEVLAQRGVPSPASLVDSCFVEATYPTFRATPIPVLA